MTAEDARAQTKGKAARFVARFTAAPQASDKNLGSGFWLTLLFVTVLPWLGFWLAPGKIDWPSSPFTLGSLPGSVSVLEERARMLLASAIMSLLAIGLVMMFSVIFGRIFWPSKDERQRNPSSESVFIAIRIVAATLVGVIGGFAACYRQISAEHHDCFVIAADHRHVLRHAEAAYFAITTFTTTGFGDITATSKVCRLVVAGQTTVGLAILAFGIAGLTARIINHLSE